jgi:3-oxoacyl-[acyl-carrier-protein] synthase II
MRTLHAETQEEVARGDDPAKLCRPFDRHRNGTVLGEGAAVLVLEELEYATARGAKIHGEIIGHASSSVSSRLGQPGFLRAVKNVLQMVLKSANLQPGDIGHINAHGLGTQQADADEAQAIHQVFGRDVPVTTAKGHFGNLGAGGGTVELVGSLWALAKGHLFPTLNYETPDPQCPVNVVTSNDVPAGENFLNLNFTPQGQASAVIVRKL